VSKAYVHDKTIMITGLPPRPQSKSTTDKKAAKSKKGANLTTEWKMNWPKNNDGSGKQPVHRIKKQEEEKNPKKREPMEKMEEVGQPVLAVDLHVETKEGDCILQDDEVFVTEDGHKIVRTEVFLQAEAGPVVIPADGMHDIADILHLMKPRAIVDVLRRAKIDISGLNDMSKRMREEARAQVPSELVRLGILESTELPLPRRRRKETAADLVDAITTNMGFISEDVLSVVPFLLERLDAFDVNGYGKIDSESEEEQGKPTTKKVRGRPAKKNKGGKPKVDKQTPAEVVIMKDDPNRKMVDGKLHKFCSLTNKFVPVNPPKTPEGYRQKRRTKDFDPIGIKEIKQQAAKDQLISEKISVYVPTDKVQDPKRWPDTYYAIYIPDTDNTWKREFGLLDCLSAERTVYPELFLLAQKDVMIDHIAPLKMLNRMGLSNLTKERVMELQLTEGRILGDSEKMEAIIQLYNQGHKEMCVSWNRFAEANVKLSKEDGWTVSLHAAAKEKFEAKSGREIAPFFIPVGLTWPCNMSEKVGHWGSCACSKGDLNPFADTAFEMLMRCKSKKLVTAMGLPASALGFASMKPACVVFDGYFGNNSIADLLSGDS